MNKLNHSLHRLALRLSIQTSVTDPSALVCKVWPTPSSSCGTHLRALRPGTSTRKFLRPSTLPASLHPVSWPSGMDHMIPTKDHLLARGWAIDNLFWTYSPSFISFPSTPTIFCRSCSLTCGEWLLLTSGIGLDSRLTLRGENKYCTLDGKFLLSWFSSHSIQVQLFLLLFIQLPLQLRSAQQPATGSHADCLHCPDPREQWVNWTLHQQHLH